MVTTIQLNISSFFYTQLNDQTALFQTIQFSIHHLSALSLNLKQFYLTQKYLLNSSATTSDQGLPGSDGNEEYSAFPQNTVHLEPRHQIALCYIQDTLWESLTLCKLYNHIRLGHRTFVMGSLIPLQRCSRSILQPHLTGLTSGWVIQLWPSKSNRQYIIYLRLKFHTHAGQRNKFYTHLSRTFTLHTQCFTIVETKQTFLRSS